MGEARRAAVWSRLLLVCVGGCLGLLIGELGLRWVWPTLPSLAALDGVDPREWGDVQRWTSPPGDPSQCGDPDAFLRVPPRTERHGTSPLRRLWVVGDSVVHGFGVGREEAWPQHVASRLTETLGTGTALTRLGGPGLGYCGLVSSLRKHLRHETPDAVVFQVFADDLEVRDLVLVNGAVAAIPRAPILQRSWLANRLWLAWVAHLGSAHPARASDRSGLDRFRKTLGSALDELAAQRIETLVVLVPPVGLPRCAHEPTHFSDCDWLTTDQALLAEELADLDHPFLDLRSLWDEAPPDTLAEEEEAWRTRGRLPVHPGPEGHQRIADRVTPELLGLLEGLPASGVDD